MNLELGTEMLLGHRRALDVPPWPPTAPRRFPGRVLARLGRLPEREVAGVLLARVRLLLLDLVEPLPAQPSVLRVARDPEVHIPLRLVREPTLDELLDHRDLVGDRLDCRGLDVGTAEAEAIGVLDIPPAGVRGEASARTGCR